MNNKSKTLAILLAFICLAPLITPQPASVSAQTSSSTSPPAIQWQQTYEGTDARVAQVSNLIQTSDGGYAFLDCGKSYQTLFVPSTLYKLDSSGNMQWNKTINLFTASNLIQTSDKGYEIAGWWNTYGTTYQTTPTLIKLNTKGDIQWYENTSTVLNLANVTTNIRTSDGGYAYFKGEITSNVGPLAVPAFVKVNSSNETQWILDLPYSGPANYDNGTIDFPFEISSLIETSDGALAGLGIADPYLSPQGLWGSIYLTKTAPFLPSPSQRSLPTPLPSPTPAPIIITVNQQILIAAAIVAVIALGMVLLIHKRHRKAANLNK